MGKNLLEEQFFFLYHMRQGLQSSMTMPINTRKWMIDRFIQQKEQENEAMESQRRKAQAASRRR